MSLIKAAGAGEQSTGFYKHLLDQSLKFNDDDSQYLTRTPASAGNRKTWTWSGWVKRGNLGVVVGLMGAAGSSIEDGLRIEDSSGGGDIIRAYLYNGGYVSQYTTVAKFRDVSAWFHIVWAFDSTDSTESERSIIYVNGVRQTLTQVNATTLNGESGINNNSAQYLGGYGNAPSNGNSFDGYIAEVNFIDGTALTADSFGETKDGIWIPKDTSSLTFGTNGFHLTFKDDVVSEGFNTAIFEGNSTTQSISGLGFSPALVWVKDRDNGNSHALSDVVRGRGRNLISNATNAEVSAAAATDKDLISFDADGFSVGQFEDGTYNNNGSSMVAWCWEAGGTPTADNSASAGATPTSGSVKIDGSNLGSALAGSIAATRLSANTARGFSIVTWTGDGGQTTVAHGLGATPKIVIQKKRGGTSDWWFYTTAVDGSYDYLKLNATDAKSDYAQTAPTSTTFVSHGWGSDTMVAYCWAEISGYSSIGSYSGTGSSGNAVTGLGFKPAFLLIKRTDVADNWHIADNTRSTDGTFNDVLRANLNNAESSNHASFDIVPNADGFTVDSTNSELNASGGTYIYMAFADTREAAFFKDVSTNGNHFTPVNLDYRDSVPDVPTNNFATLNPLSSYSTIALSEGNLKASESANVGRTAFSSIALQSGKWYFEAYVQTAGTYVGIGLSDDSYTGSSYTGDSANSYGYLSHSGSKYNNGAAVGYGATFTAGDIVSAAFDVTTGTLTFYKNGVSQGTAFTSISLEQFFTVTSRNGVIIANFGQDSSFAGNHATANSNADGNGHGSFAYAPPSGYLALCSQNLPDVEIIDGTEYFNTVLWTGNGSDGRSITGVGFDPDFVWIKSRNLTTSHLLNDTVRGANKSLFSEGTTAETADNGGGYLSAFVTDGFSVTSGSSGDDAVNDSSDTYVSWNWLAGTAVSNTDGSITSSVSANTTAGFSVVTYTHDGTNSSTVGHSLGVTPSFIINKQRTAVSNWRCYHKSLSSGYNIQLNLTQGQSVAGDIFQTAPTSSVFTPGNGDSASGKDFIAYCFHSVEGYSKVGSYVGNNNADGTFVYTGFRPAWVMVKAYSTGGTHYDWAIYDSVRSPTNAIGAVLEANQSQAEVTGTGRGLPIDFVSNGFKFRSSYAESNAAVSYIYLAFAEQPFKFANAR